LAALLLLLTANAPVPPPLRPASGPAVELVETIPVESGLGDPTLPQAARVWVEMIDGAGRTLDLEHFYLSHWPGEPTGPVIDAIGRAAARGVQVRLILDVHFQATYPQPADSLGKLRGIQLHWIDMKKLSGGGVQHAKYMVADETDLFVGSQNLDWRALKHIHELGVRVRDPRIAGLFEQVFEYDWKASAPGAAPPPPGSAGRLSAGVLAALPLPLIQAPGDTVRVWPGFAPRNHIPDPALWDQDQIARLLDGAKGEVMVQVLTYSLGRGLERDSTLDQALRHAAARGVKVRLLVSDWEADNPRIAELQKLTTVPNIEVRLSSVPQWSGGYIPFARVEHCKYMVVDSLWTWVGTSNWEPDYFHLSRNAGLSLENRAIARRARAIFETGWKAAAQRRLTAGATVAKRVHGDAPPPGQKAYGK
jgi:phosphatidylserine/phosphatidylglycerophosphate/cardiolipin synthase-like enzyme